MKRNDINITKLPTYITACCVLHNLCELHGDSCEEDWIVPDTVNTLPGSSNAFNTLPTAAATQTSIRIREALCDYFDSI